MAQTFSLGKNVTGPMKIAAPWATSHVFFAQFMLRARYGGVVVRDAVRDGADWFVNDFEDLTQALERHQVAFIGSGEPNSSNVL